MDRVDLEGKEVPAERERAREPYRAIASEGPDLEDATRPHRSGEHVEEPSLGRGDLDRRETGRGAVRERRLERGVPGDEVLLEVPVDVVPERRGHRAPSGAGQRAPPKPLARVATTGLAPGPGGHPTARSAGGRRRDFRISLRHPLLTGAGAHPVTRALPIAVLASGEGTTLEGLAEEVDAGRLPARIVLVVADRPGARALDRARRRAIPAVLLPARGVDRESWSARLTEEISAHGAELVVLAGFLRVLPPSWVERWRGRAINLHPALLPKYGGPGMYGHHVHEAVLAAKETETGVTVHEVTGAVDGGPVLLQEKVPVVPGDTPEDLRDRVHPVEVRLLAEAIRRFAEGGWPLPYPLLAEAPSAGGDAGR